MTVLFLKVFIRENIDTREALDQVDQEDNTGHTDDDDEPEHYQNDRPVERPHLGAGLIGPGFGFGIDPDNETHEKSFLQKRERYRDVEDPSGCNVFAVSGSILGSISR